MPTPIEEYDYHLPPDLIAQEPASPRDHARLFVLDRATGKREHRRVRDLPDYLVSGDVLVVNDTRVFPARLFGQRRATSGKIEGLLIERVQGSLWRMMLKSGGKLRAGERVCFAHRAVEVALVEKDEHDGTWVVDFHDADALNVAERFGVPPVPPYIHRDREDPRSRTLDREAYQTVFAHETGAIAAPTAGLHFTEGLLARMDAAGVERVTVTLHVGMGTFLPVKTATLEEHPMHSERFHMTADAGGRIAAAKAQGRRVIAVGTTSTRVLETLSFQPPFREERGETDLFIMPPYAFRNVDVLMTNFHLPKSTLLALVAAFAGRETVLDAYREAVERGYRFYSYGDAMLIL